MGKWSWVRAIGCSRRHTELQTLFITLLSRTCTCTVHLN